MDYIVRQHNQLPYKCGPPTPLKDFPGLFIINGNIIYDLPNRREIVRDFENYNQSVRSKNTINHFKNHGFKQQGQSNPSKLKFFLDRFIFSFEDEKIDVFEIKEVLVNRTSLTIPYSKSRWADIDLVILSDGQKFLQIHSPQDYILLFSLSDFSTLVLKDYDYHRKMFLLPDVVLLKVISTTEKVHYDLYNFIKKKVIHTFEIDKAEEISYQDKIIYVSGINKTTMYKVMDETEIPDEDKCVICFSLKTKNLCPVPCGHVNYCDACSKKINVCSICKTNITMFIKIYN